MGHTGRRLGGGLKVSEDYLDHQSVKTNLTDNKQVRWFVFLACHFSDQSQTGVTTQAVYMKHNHMNVYRS